MNVEKTICCSNCIFCIRKQHEFGENEYWCNRYPQRVYKSKDQVCGEFCASNGFKEGYASLKTYLYNRGRNEK